jgi:hypothetical protein
MRHVRREKGKPFDGKHEANKPLGSYRSKWEVNIKQILKKQDGRG